MHSANPLAINLSASSMRAEGGAKSAPIAGVCEPCKPALASAALRCHHGSPWSKLRALPPRPASSRSSRARPRSCTRLGAGRSQIARSHECDWPAAVLALPALTRPKFKVEGSSRAIDQAVRALVEQGLAVYEVDAEALQALEPDVILTQDQCEVCAVSLADVERAVCAWVGSAPTGRVAAPAYDGRHLCGHPPRREGTECTPEGESLIADMQTPHRRGDGEGRGPPEPRLAFIEWIDPPMSGGHWMPELIDAAGGINLFGERGAPVAVDHVGGGRRRRPRRDPRCAVRLRHPDDRARDACARRQRDLAGFAGGAPGPGVPRRRQRLLQPAGPAARRERRDFAEILHPDVCDFGHRGREYVPYEGEHTPKRKKA